MNNIVDIVNAIPALCDIIKEKPSGFSFYLRCGVF